MATIFSTISALCTRAPAPTPRQLISVKLPVASAARAPSATATRASRSSGTRTLYHARARLAGQPETPSRFILFLPENLLRMGEQLGCLAQDASRCLHGLGRRRRVGRLQ